MVTVRYGKWNASDMRDILIGIASRFMNGPLVLCLRLTSAWYNSNGHKSDNAVSQAFSEMQWKIWKFGNIRIYQKVGIVCTTWTKWLGKYYWPMWMGIHVDTFLLKMRLPKPRR